MIEPSRIKRIAVLTGGGDCPGLNAVIRGIVRAAVLEHGWEVLGVHDGYDGFFSADPFRRLTSKDVRGLQLRGGTILGTSNRGNPLHYPVKRRGKTVYMDVTDDVVKRLKSWKVDVLVAVGGDGTMKITQAIFEKACPSSAYRRRSITISARPT
jgi:6-phosphofructokinase